MPFIGQQPITGAYHKLDSITTSATATYNLQLNGGAYYPTSANHLLVSLNGVMQAPQDSFTVSGSQITFASALTSSDSIDFIMALGDVLDIGVPSDGAVNTSQLANSAVTDAKIAGMSSSKLTGALPALDGSALTGITSFTDILNVYTNKIVTDLEVGSGGRFTWSEAQMTVTPTSSSSQFLLVLDSGSWSTTSSTTGYMGFNRVVGGVTTEFPASTWTIRLYPNGSDFRDSRNQITQQLIDAPATTSAVTYQIYLERASGSDSVAIGPSGPSSGTYKPTIFTIYELGTTATIYSDGA